MPSRWNLYRNALERADEAEDVARTERHLREDMQRELFQAQSRIQDLFAENSRLRAASEADRSESLRCRELVADWLTSQTGLKPIFGHPFESKAAPDAEPIRSGRRQARDIVEELENEFFKDQMGMNA